ncbi:2028_t:CDS:1, partial [Gigaspora rosea]
AAVVAIKGNAFIFGGFIRSDMSINKNQYIYSPNHGFITPQYRLPTPFNDGVVGVWNDKLSIIMMDTGKNVMK